MWNVAIEDWRAQEPGHSVTLGRSWEGEYYVKHTYSEPGNWLGGVRHTIAYGATPEEALAAEQKEQR